MVHLSVDMAYCICMAWAPACVSATVLQMPDACVPLDAVPCSRVLTAAVFGCFAGAQKSDMTPARVKEALGVSAQPGVHHNAYICTLLPDCISGLPLWYCFWVEICCIQRVHDYMDCT